MRARILTALQNLPALARSRNSPAARRFTRKHAAVAGACPREERRPRRRDDIRVFSLTPLRRRGRWPGCNETTVPYLRMSGRWLQECGFEIGARVYLKVEHGRLIVMSEDPAAAIAASV